MNPRDFDSSFLMLPAIKAARDTFFFKSILLLLLFLQEKDKAVYH